MLVLGCWESSRSRESNSIGHSGLCSCPDAEANINIDLFIIHAEHVVHSAWILF